MQEPLELGLLYQATPTKSGHRKVSVEWHSSRSQRTGRRATVRGLVKKDSSAAWQIAAYVVRMLARSVGAA